MLDIHRRPLLAFAVVAYAFSWAVWGAGLAASDRPWELSDPPLAAALVVGSFGPSVAAVVVSAALGGRVEVARLLRGLLRFRVAWWVYLATFLVPPTVFLAIFVVASVPTESGVVFLLLNLVVAMPLNAVLGGVLFGTGPLGEELGWRGFALPRLVQSLGGDVPASVVLGLLWAAWHLPLAFVTEWRIASWWVWVLAYPVSIIALSLAITTVWRWGRESIVIAVLAHATLNQTAVIVAGDNAFDLAGLSNDELFLAVVAAQAGVAAVFGGLFLVTRRRRTVRQL